MTRTLLTLAILLVGHFGYAQVLGNYIVVVNGDSIYTDLNKDFEYRTTSGENLKVLVTQPDILTYQDDMISFKHNRSLTVSNSRIDTGVEQCMIVKSTGNGFMVQKYHTMNPSSLTQLMLHELTKESIGYGYAKSETEFKKQIKSGETIEGVQATLTYKGEKEVYTVATYGAKDEGVIVITMMLNQDFEEDREIIDLFLNTLSIVR